ncbi:MAG: hypothetical protein WDN46_06835 [Methylocella sp.]
MPDFKDIEGNEEDGHAASARQAFEKLIIEILRGLGQQNDDGYGTTIALIDLVKKLGEAHVPLGPLIGETIAELRDSAFVKSQSERETEMKSVLEAALKLTVEYLAEDGLAKGRQSKRDTALKQAIEEALLSSERRSRDAGWSYLQTLSDRVGKWPPGKK